MKQVLEAAAEVQTFLEDCGWKFCFIGGIALQKWAIPRNTIDADLTILVELGAEAPVIHKLIERFEPRITEEPERFFLRSRVVLVRCGNVGIDISLGVLPFEQSAVERSEVHEFVPGISLRICTAEDLVVFKAFANRLKDWADIEGILRMQTTLDWNYVIDQLTPLVQLKEEPEIMETLSKLRNNTGHI